MTDHYAVIGNPIAHSKSPQIHMTFAEQTRQDIEYTAMLVEHGDFVNAIKNFQQNGGKGLNITVPFKNEAYALADTHSQRAKLAGAVNTLILKSDGSIHGDNTDGVGIIRDLLDNNSVQIQDARLLILGAGGAVQGVLHPLLGQSPEIIVIANRTVAKAEMLAQTMNDKLEGFDIVRGCGFAELAGQQFDGIINGSAASLQGEVPPLPDDVLQEGGWCYDMMYGNEPTAFVRWGEIHGAAKSLDGLGMLVEQAAESFKLWRGVQPKTRHVIQMLRNTA